MFCAQCGKPLDAGARFCPSCGMVREAPQPPFAAGLPRSGQPRPGQLVRSRSHRMIAGICGGLSEHYGWDLSLVRILAAVSVLFSGAGLLAYIVAWIVMPEGQYALPFGSPMPPPPRPAAQPDAQPDAPL